MTRFAIFLKSIQFEQLAPDIRKVYLFEREKEVITATGHELLTLYDLNYLLLWLLDKGLKQIYVNGIGKDIKEQIERIDILVNELNEIKDNPLLKTILWNE